MARRNRRAPDPEPREVRGGNQRVEEHADGEWVVRRLTGSSSTKTYRCPGCDHEIRPATPHVVAWPFQGREDDRRHWHTACWSARERRGPTPGRGRR